MIRSGELRYRVEIEQRTEVADGIGGFTTTWSRYCYLRAGIWPLRGSEVIEAGRLEHRITHRIKTRYKSGIEANMRVKHGSRYFDIIQVIVRDEKNHEMEFLAVEGTT